MQETMTNDIENLDFSTIAALRQKRTLAFVNHFVIGIVKFLNNFNKNCEQKLMHFERKLEKVEAAMVLLEARLSSIPEINTTQEEKSKESLIEIESKEPESKENLDEVSKEVIETSNPSYPEYERFVKMVQVGVPLPAVKLKLTSEGLNPIILDQILNK